MRSFHSKVVPLVLVVCIFAFYGAAIMFPLMGVVFRYAAILALWMDAR